MNTIYNKFNSKIERTAAQYHYLVHCANEDCNELIRVKKGTWEKNIKSDNPTILSCSKKCRSSKFVYKLIFDKNLKNHGCGNPFNNPDIQIGIRKLMLEKYGSENISQTDHFKVKSKETFLKNFGYDNPQKCPEINNRTNQTRKDKYGDNLNGWAVKSTTFETNLNRYGNKWYFASDEGKQTLENYIHKYGSVDGVNKWNKRVQLSKQTLENFITRYGIVEGNLRYENWKRTCSQTLSNFIHRHGEINGTLLYDEYRSKCLKNLLKNGSKTKLNDDFDAILLNYIPATLINREFPIKEDRWYIYDFFFPSKNIIIEVHGDFWHCNPNKYVSGQFINWPGKIDKVLVDDVWVKDEIKRQIALKNGMEYYYFWEFDIRNNVELIKNQLKELLLDDKSFEY